MNKFRKGLAIVFACLVFATVLTSCGKRNVGCPNAFKVEVSK